MRLQVCMHRITRVDRCEGKHQCVSECHDASHVSRSCGHCDNPAFPVDYETLAVGAKENGVIFEINEASLAPYGYRG